METETRARSKRYKGTTATTLKLHNFKNKIACSKSLDYLNLKNHKKCLFLLG